MDPVLFPAPGHAAVVSGLGDGVGDGAHHAFVEDAGDDVVLGQMIVGNDGGDGVGGGQFHRLVDGAGANVEGAAENPGEGQQVVHLVGVVGAAGGHDPAERVGQVGRHLGVRVGHGEDDAIFDHLLQVFRLQKVAHGDADEDVGAGQRLA